MSKILLVTGSRNIFDYDFVSHELNIVRIKFKFDTIIHGGALGIDMSANLYAIKHNISTIIKEPEWNMYGKAAGPIRNKTMVDLCDKGIAIWDGKSRGTKDCINKLKKANKLLKVVYYSLK